MTQEVATAAEARATLVGKLDAAEASIPGLEQALAEATAAIQQDHSQTPPEEVIALSASASKATSELDGGRNDIDKLKRGIAALDMQEKREQVVSAISPVVSAIAKGFSWDKFPCDFVLTGNIPAEALPSEYAAVMLEHDVKSLSVKVVVGERLVDVKPSGATARAPRTSTGNGRGGRKRMTPQGPMNLSEVFKAYAKQAGVSDERIEKVLADPSNQGISHRGKAVADKLEFPEVEDA